MAQPAPDWWQSWFGPEYLALYDSYLQERTPAEIDGLEALLGIKPPLPVLDLPCGQGRHAIELARRGYQVTGVDLSTYLLGVARRRAADVGVSIRWVEGDMRQPLADQHFEIVLNLFTSFGYFAAEADDRKVANAALGMLRPGGRFVLEVINGDRILAHFEEREWFTVGEAAVMERRSLDRGARRMLVERTVARSADSQVSFHAVRLYGPRELRALLHDCGFERVDLYGDWDGAPATSESLRVLAVATSGR
jgi:SAM-dependent methyltransferase